MQKHIKLCHVHVDNLDTDTADQVKALVTQGLTDGVVRPLHSQIFTHDQLSEAVRFKEKHPQDLVAIQVSCFPYYETKVKVRILLWSTVQTFTNEIGLSELIKNSCVFILKTCPKCIPF